MSTEDLEGDGLGIQRDVLTDKVYERLRSDLLSNQIKQGERINLGALAKRFQTSNTPLRQALARLESEGLVVSNAYKGFTAAPALDPKSVTDLYDIRLMIEPVTARIAATRVNEDNLASLEQAFLAYEVASQGGGTYTSALSQPDLDFHAAVAACSGNGQVGEILGRIMISMRVYDERMRTGAVTETIQEHGRILDAIRARDPEAAAEAMRRHLEGSQQRWGRALNS